MDPDDDDLSFDPATRESQVLGQAEMRVLFLIEKQGKSNKTTMIIVRISWAA